MKPAFDWTDQGELDDEEDEKKFYGVVTGQVIDVLDPMNLGRVRVMLSFLDSLEPSDWAQVAVPMAGLAHGTYFIPNVGDQVLVAFEHGDVRAPYVIGSLWTAFAPPPVPSPLLQIRVIRSPIGSRITFTEAPPMVSISSPTGTNAIEVTEFGILIRSGTNTLTVDATGIHMVVGGTAVAVTDLGITGPKLTITSPGLVTIKGSTVSIN